MENKIILLNVVVLANKFNPTIPTKDWLLDRKVFASEPNDYINTPILSAYDTSDFLFQLDEGKLQIQL